MGEKKKTREWLVGQIPKLGKLKDVAAAFLTNGKKPYGSTQGLKNVNCLIEKQRNWKRNWDQKI